MTSVLPVLLLFTNIIIAIFLIALFFSLKRYEKNLSSYYDKKAKRVLEDAKRQAVDIVENAKIFSSKLEKESKEAIDKNLTTNKQAFDEFYSNLREEQVKKQEEFLGLLNEQNIKILEKSASDLNSQTALRATEIKKQLENELTDAISQINDYKKQRQESIKSNVEEILTNSILSALPDYISVENQEKLVEEAVEKAIKSSFFKT